jgi:hypothetical protein
MLIYDNHIEFFNIFTFEFFGKKINGGKNTGGNKIKLKYILGGGEEDQMEIEDKNIINELKKTIEYVNKYTGDDVIVMIDGDENTKENNEENNKNTEEKKVDTIIPLFQTRR